MITDLRRLLSISRLNLLKVAPGGHIGLFCIWTAGAFRKLDDLYGTWRKASTKKVNYNLPMHKMTNTDLNRILKSEEVQKALHPSDRKIKRRVLKNLGVIMLPMQKMTNTDLNRILKSEEVQKALHPSNCKIKRRVLKNLGVIMLPMQKMTNTDLNRILKSDEVQMALHPFDRKIKRRVLKNLGVIMLPMQKMTNTDLNRILKSDEVQMALHPFEYVKTKMLKPKRKRILKRKVKNFEAAQA
ncbi:hypothetical protein DNTS_026607 [Danionella cerebrum]|uniref:Large ribosomal subunit protein uL4 C-terminal domain-containing protein n=1 Tax=Danionella cerebrum TaxID=2873325 RepID=A0A553RQP7_9TELE|nr:hypothetical protein DNTS_026607 [Danionella translucida]